MLSEQGRCQLIRQSTEGCCLHTGILFTHYWSSLGMKYRTFSQKHFPAETLQRDNSTHHLDKDVGDFPNKTLAALKCSSQAALQKGLESCIIHLVLVRKVDWCWDRLAAPGSQPLPACLCPLSRVCMWLEKKKGSDQKCKG